MKAASVVTLPHLSVGSRGPSTLLSGSPISATPRSVRSVRYASPLSLRGGAGDSPSPLLTSRSSAARTQKQARIEQLRKQADNVRVERVLPTRKIAPNLKRLRAQLLQSGRKADDKVPLVLVSVGKFNPVHLIHIHMFEVAKHYLERHTNFAVVGGLICPSHDKFVRAECRGTVCTAIPARRRAAMCRVLTSSSSWIDVCRWEITRTCGFLDFPAVLETTQRYLRETLGESLQVMYLCGIAQLVKCTPETLLTYGCICVARVGREEEVADAFASQHPGSVHVAEDSTVLHYRLAGCSSTKIRRLLANDDPNGELADYVGVKVAKYMAKHGIAARVAGRVRWSDADSRIPELEMVDAETLAAQVKAAAVAALSPGASPRARVAADKPAASPGRVQQLRSGAMHCMSPHRHAVASGRVANAAVSANTSDAAKLPTSSRTADAAAKRLHRWSTMRDEPSASDVHDESVEVNASWYRTISSPSAPSSTSDRMQKSKSPGKAGAAAVVVRTKSRTKRAPVLPVLALPAHRSRNYVSVTVTDEVP